MPSNNIQFQASRNFVKEMDDADELAVFRTEFLIPQVNGRDSIYLCGNSLGLQPKNVKQNIEIELNDWAKFGVEGHFEAQNPWFSYHHLFTQSLAKLVGATDKEVVAMNTLTVNLQLLMLSFYKPTKDRFKIIMEAGAFPSDMYAVETLVTHFGLNPSETIIEIKPRENEHLINEEDILLAIEKNKDSLAMLMMGGVNYYTGQLFDIEKITNAVHNVGAIAGYDLAHAVGNVPLQLHNWNVDFACWCSYKYLNSGPGAVGGAFVHETHSTSSKTHRLAGWWGQNEKTRFKMEKGFDPIPNAQSWQMSNAPVMNMVAHKTSLEIFNKVGLEKLRQKSLLLTGFLEFLLKQITNVKFEIITPKNPTNRGCQLSLLFIEDGEKTFEQLKKNGVIADWREPNVIRIAPVPLYNSFQDVYEFYSIIKNM